MLVNLNINFFIESFRLRDPNACEWIYKGEGKVSFLVDYDGSATVSPPLLDAAHVSIDARIRVKLLSGQNFQISKTSVCWSTGLSVGVHYTYEYGEACNCVSSRKSWPPILPLDIQSFCGTPEQVRHNLVWICISIEHCENVLVAKIRCGCAQRL